MMKHLGVDAMPGVPDFNQSTIAMGQQLLNPPSVAGWAGGKAWITPGLLIARGNVARDVLIPDMTGFRDWNFTAGTDDVLGKAAARRLRRRRGDGRQRPGEDEHVRPRGARAGRAVQHPHLRATSAGSRPRASSFPRRAMPRSSTSPRMVRGERREDDRRGGGLPGVADAARADRARPTRDALVAFLTEGARDRQHRPREDLHGRSAPHDGAPDHEHAGVSNRVTLSRAGA